MINIALCPLDGRACAAIYMSSKHAVIGLTKQLAMFKGNQE
ncbi:hypothetical protein P9125_02535 [Bacillus mojavensis]|nr:hypothetical protein [Bacillus mojavensis]MEC3586856.1 hypothetical protein [Bacillus mojavensis]MEC5242046.1 hypothetical protein [Bacillus mojavensis]MED0748969.1 hypothetical protein [Bacillus mojavensis]